MTEFRKEREALEALKAASNKMEKSQSVREKEAKKVGKLDDDLDQVPTRQKPAAKTFNSSRVKSSIPKPAPVKKQ